MIAVSDYVRRSAHRDLQFSLDKIDLVYNPVDIDLLTAPGLRNRAAVLGEHGLRPEDLILLNVARVSPQKGLVYAVRALPAILRQFPSVQLVSVGATTDDRWVKQLNREAETLGVAGHFHMLGAQPNVVEFLRSCDVFVFPSLYEGLGIALIEAMAAGAACIASNVGPIPEVVQDGIDGVLVSPADPDDFARAVCDLLADPAKRSRLGTAASETAVRRFQPQESAERLTGIYESVVNDRRR
jgi:glycosyltransferase involved in cell wall biosynthesis